MFHVPPCVSRQSSTVWSGDDLKMSRLCKGVYIYMYLCIFALHTPTERGFLSWFLTSWFLWSPFLTSLPWLGLNLNHQWPTFFWKGSLIIRETFIGKKNPWEVQGWDDMNERSPVTSLEVTYPSTVSFENGWCLNPKRIIYDVIWENLIIH